MVVLLSPNSAAPLLRPTALPLRPCNRCCPGPFRALVALVALSLVAFLTPTAALLTTAFLFPEMWKMLRLLKLLRRHRSCHMNCSMTCYLSLIHNDGIMTSYRCVCMGLPRYVLPCKLIVDCCACVLRVALLAVCRHTAPTTRWLASSHARCCSTLATSTASPSSGWLAGRALQTGGNHYTHASFGQ